MTTRLPIPEPVDIFGRKQTFLETFEGLLVRDGRFSNGTESVLRAIRIKDAIALSVAGDGVAYLNDDDAALLKEVAERPTRPFTAMVIGGGEVGIGREILPFLQAIGAMRIGDGKKEKKR